MNGSFWWGVLAGVLAAFFASFACSMLFMLLISRLPMAEERTWTDDDDNDVLRLIRDANGES